MLNLAKKAVLATATLMTLAGAAQAFDLVMPTEAKLVPTSAQLGIISPPDHVCPGQGKLTAWVRTNKPGTVNILIVRKGGNVAGPFAVTTVKGSGGVVIGSYTQNIPVLASIDAEYRVVIAGTPVASNWAPLVADC